MRTDLGIARAARVCALAGALAATAPAHLSAASYPCLVEPHVVVELSTAAEGVLDEVKVHKGDRVEQGAVLAKLQSTMEEAQVEHARARAEMTSEIRAKEVSLARAREKHQRAVKLSSQRFVSPDELEELKSAADLAQLDLESALENKTLAEIELDRARALLDLRSIRSPISGVVVERYLDPGEFAQAQPIARIAQLDPLNVEAILPGELYGTVKEGAMAQVTVAEPSRRSVRAPVAIVEKVIDAASGTFGVRIELPNADYAIPAGLECTVAFDSGGGTEPAGEGGPTATTEETGLHRTGR